MFLGDAWHTPFGVRRSLHAFHEARTWVFYFTSYFGPPCCEVFPLLPKASLSNMSEFGKAIRHKDFVLKNALTDSLRRSKWKPINVNSHPVALQDGVPRYTIQFVVSWEDYESEHEKFPQLRVITLTEREFYSQMSPLQTEDV